MLSHADVTVTLKVYAYVLPSMQEQAAKSYGSLIWPVLTC
jgi:hypothetical protein